MRTRLSGLVSSNLSTNDSVRCEPSESRAEVIEEREERQTLGEGNDAFQDRLSAVTIALDQISKLPLKNSDHIEPNWTPIPTKLRIGKPKFEGNVRGRENSKTARETQIKDLKLRVDELESNKAKLLDKFEHLENAGEGNNAELHRLEIERVDKDAKIETAGREIGRLSARVRGLEEELEHTTDRLEGELGEVVDRAQLHEELSDGLKDNLAQAKAELNELRNRYNDAQAQVQEHSARGGGLSSRMNEVTRARDSGHLARTKAEREMRDFGEKLLDAEDEIKSLGRELSDVERSLHNKELDEKTSARIPESGLERLKRDLTRREHELVRVRNDVKDRERVRQERETLLDKLVNPLSITGSSHFTSKVIYLN